MSARVDERALTDAAAICIDESMMSPAERTQRASYLGSFVSRTKVARDAQLQLRLHSSPIGTCDIVRMLAEALPARRARFNATWQKTFDPRDGKTNAPVVFDMR